MKKLRVFLYFLIAVQLYLITYYIGFYQGEMVLRVFWTLFNVIFLGVNIGNVITINRLIAPSKV